MLSRDIALGFYFVLVVLFLIQVGLIHVWTAGPYSWYIVLIPAYLFGIIAAVRAFLIIAALSKDHKDVLAVARTEWGAKGAGWVVFVGAAVLVAGALDGADPTIAFIVLYAAGVLFIVAGIAACRYDLPYHAFVAERKHPREYKLNDPSLLEEGLG